MLYNICFLFSLFIIYSIIGWMTECVACSIEWKRMIKDRGFLIGPYCPIYGCGGLFSYVFFSKYYDDPLTLFILAAVGASVLEYVTSYFMEKMFKARWWDYSHRRFNLEGRVCLGNALLFGLMGMIFVYLINPFFTNILKSIPNNILIIASIIAFIIFLTDNILTFMIVTKLKLRITKIKQDLTEEIDKQVKEFLTSYSFFIKRIFNAFPRISFALPTGESIKNKIQDVLNSIDKSKKNK